MINLSIEVEPTKEGANTIEIGIRAFLYLRAEDPIGCIEVLLDTSNQPGIPKQTREQFILAAATVDLFYGLERAFEIAERALELEQISSDLITVTAMRLFAASARLDAKGLSRSRSVSDRLTIKLCLKGLALGVSGAEAVYSLARTFMHYSPDAAIAIYKGLLKVHPFYEERWYFHRDLGLIYYSKRKYRKAAQYYDTASRLKPDDSELTRFAGDTYYYRGNWVEALQRYEKAISIEPAETYFLDSKIDFAKSKIRSGIYEEKLWGVKRCLAQLFSSLGDSLAEWNITLLAKALFQIALWICSTDLEASRWYALYANRRGQYKEAINYLKVCLCNVPENPSNRLNLTLNMIFEAKGGWTDLARRQAKAAIFHGGPATKDRFRLCLINTSTKDELVEEFERLFDQVVGERKAWQERRQTVLAPQKFGEITHFEVRE